MSLPKIEFSEKHLRLHSQVPDEQLKLIAQRDAALWYDGEVDDEATVRLLTLPWRIVLCESSSSALAQGLLERNEGEDPFRTTRGYVHLLAGEVQPENLPRRALPIALLNGRDNGAGRDSSSVGKREASRRRLNLIEEMQRLAPKQLFVLAPGHSEIWSELKELWAEGFRSYLTVLSPSAELEGLIEAWRKSDSPAPPLISGITEQDRESLVQDLESRLLDARVSGRLVVRMRLDDKSRDVDITKAELVERPLLDRFDLIEAVHLRQLDAPDLSFEELQSFFRRTTDNWRPFAAGLPYIYDLAGLVRKLEKALRRVESFGPTNNQVRYITAESGSEEPAVDEKKFGHRVGRVGAQRISFRGQVTAVARQVMFDSF